jgi:hypothetical protein
LQINAQKTRIIETKELIEESWKYKLKGLKIAPARHEQRNDIHHFFETLLALEKQYRDESVVKYGLKLVSSSIIKKPNWHTFEAYLLHCAFAFPNTLQVVASLLTTYAKYGYPIDRSAIGRFCNAVVQSHSRSDNHSEIAWALWIMFELNIPLMKQSVEALEQVSSSVCLLLTASLIRRQKATFGISSARLQSYSLNDALYSDGWLFAYEGGRRLWLDKRTSSHIAADKYFGPMLACGVSFFNEAARIPPIFSLKSNTFSHHLFESDANLDDYFEFDNADEEYFDSGSDDEDDSLSEDEWLDLLGR